MSTWRGEVNDLTGKTFGWLTVLYRVDVKRKGDTWWLCRCKCGKEVVKRYSVLRRQNQYEIHSCGCSKHWNKTHGGKGTRLYECWRHMRYRCDNPSNQAYKDYGARGIKVCKEWYDFAVFRKWALENGYSDTLTIDRIDTNGNYEPSNCRWADSYTQMNNRRTCPRYELDGEKLTMSEWSHKTGIPRSTILNRLSRGWSFEEAIKGR